MKVSHIEHLGIAVQSIDESLPYFEEVLGLKCYNVEVVEDQKVKTAFLKCGEVKLELLTRAIMVCIMSHLLLRMVWRMLWPSVMQRA